MPDHPARKPVVEPIGDSSPERGLRAPISGSNDHVITLLQLVYQALDIFWAVLTIAIHEDNYLARTESGAGFYSRPIT
jgi:hypothetical protein